MDLIQQAHQKLSRQIARLNHKIEVQERKLDRERRNPTLFKSANEQLIHLVESTRIHIVVKTKRCGRCNFKLDIRFFIGKAKYCQECQNLALNEYNQRRRIKISRYQKSPEYKIKRNTQVRDRLKKDPQFKLTATLRRRVLSFVKSKGLVKLKSTGEMLGCDYPFLKQHIESQFTEGMSWENMGKWHIDHKIPLATAKTSEDIIRLNHYSNLQPLWAIDNLKKGSKIYVETF